VALNAVATATFSEPMDPATITDVSFTLVEGVTPIAGVVTYDAATDIATFNPDLDLEVDAVYTAAVTTVAADLGGTTMVLATTWSFNTGVAPEVLSTDPVDLAVEVPDDVTPSVTFNEDMDGATITDLTFTIADGLGPVPGVVTFDPLTNIATLTPDLPLDGGTTYTGTVTTGVTDISGFAMAAPFSWSFTVGVRPEVIATNPLNLAIDVTVNVRPSATFSKDMDATTITDLTFVLTDGVLPVDGAVSYNPLTDTATFTPDFPLDINVTYTATLSGDIADTGGLTLAGPFTWTFTTDPCSLTPINLRSAAAFAILAGSTVTSTGNTIINGDLGVSPGSAVTGFGPGIVNGTQHAADPVSSQAIADATTAFIDAAGRSLCAVTVAGNLGGQTLAPGLYTSTSSLEISSGDLTLDAQGQEDAVFILQMASTLTTTSGRQVLLSGGAQASNIFWQVGTSATIGTTSSFQGTIIADQAITLNTGASLGGRAIAIIAAVSLDNNNVVRP